MSIYFRKISDDMFPPGSAGIFRQKSIGSCDHDHRNGSHLSFSGCARAARQSIGNIGSILTRKMAASTSQTTQPWGNTKDEYELGKVIGGYLLKYYFQHDNASVGIR